jgi:hypothetical protein
VAARGGASGPVATFQEGNFGATEATLAGGDVFLRGYAANGCVCAALHFTTRGRRLSWMTRAPCAGRCIRCRQTACHSRNENPAQGSNEGGVPREALNEGSAWKTHAMRQKVPPANRQKPLAYDDLKSNIQVL